MLNYGRLFILFSILRQGDLISPRRSQTSEILDYINPNIEPCDNFYKFSCGNFLKTAVIPVDDTLIDNRQILGMKVMNELSTLLVEESSPDEPRPFQLAKTFYRNCRKSYFAEKSLYLDVRNSLWIFGGWPVVEGELWNEDDFNWIELIWKLDMYRYPSNYFMSLSRIDVKIKEIWNKIMKTSFGTTTRRVISIQLPEFMISRRQVKKDNIEKEFSHNYEKAIKYAVMLGANETRAKIEMKESVEFGIKLAKISLLREELQDYSTHYKLMTVNQLSKKYKSIPWRKYLNILLNRKYKFKGCEFIAVMVPTYLKELEKLIQQTPKKTQFNYILWATTEFLMNLVFRESEGRLVGKDCITHGFGPFGSSFDKYGKRHGWWELKARDEFLKIAYCLIRQYNNYTVEEIGQSVDGDKTLEENVADHGGIKAAYSAYQKWVDRNGPEPMLPGLNYTPSQLFWISRARVSCVKYTPKFLKEKVMNCKHSPSEFRIVGSLSNSPEFAKDFQCPLGSRMNPEKKCSVW